MSFYATIASEVPEIMYTTSLRRTLKTDNINFVGKIFCKTRILIEKGYTSIILKLISNNFLVLQRGAI